MVYVILRPCFFYLSLLLLFQSREKKKSCLFFLKYIVKGNCFFVELNKSVWLRGDEKMTLKKIKHFNKCSFSK